MNNHEERLVLVIGIILGICTWQVIRLVSSVVFHINL